MQSGCSGETGSAAEALAKTRPNIVLILADDVALMDFGAYGGEAATPNIDALAANGTLFTNYHTSPMCAPSRAMLMTGLDSHRTGVPNLPIFLPDEYKAKPGYEGVLDSKVQTIATRLKRYGYDTYITGKWNLGHTETTLPSQRGFDRSYILDASGADNYEQRPYLPGQGKPPWFKDGAAVDLPADFYSSQFLVDQMIAFMIEERRSSPDTKNPFFAYIAFQAVHIPVQVPREYSEKYLDTYEAGWDSLRAARFEKAKALGLVPDSAQLGDMLPVLRKWRNIPADARKSAAKSMAVNAGMLDAMDHHIGRYISYLKQIGEFENTIFVVTSDNGPEASDPSLLPGMSEWLRSVGYSNDYETLGEKRSFVVIGPEFASAAAGPSAFFKFYAGEGGLRVPLIMSGPGIPKGEKETNFSFVTDIVPSILEIAELPPTADSISSFNGSSVAPVLRGQADRIHDENEIVGMEAAGQAALFRGDYKLVRNNPPYGDGVWRLYNLAIDPGETQDLSVSQPKLFDDLCAAYDAYAEENGVLAMPKGYEAIKEIQRRNQNRQAI